MIRSKLHTLLESYTDDTPLRRDLMSDPLFLFDDEIADLLLKSKAARQSFDALAEFGHLHLPYLKMTLQFKGTGSSSSLTMFVSLREEDGVFWGRTVFMSPDGSAVICEKGTTLKPDRDSFECTVDGGTRADAQIAAAAVIMGVLMTYIGGLDREVVEAPERLNRKRVQKGREPVRGYSYVHVARVVDRSGQTHERGGSTGRHMPIHMRAGHVRQQVYGPERSLRKPIWVPPVLVNYKPGETEGPVIEKRVVA